MNGIELIAQERQKQIDKHGFTGEHHAQHPKWYEGGQLLSAARHLSSLYMVDIDWRPHNWDPEWYRRLCNKSFKGRIIIAAALIAAELDRFKALEELEDQGAYGRVR